jgi:hypothetical protein
MRWKSLSRSRMVANSNGKNPPGRQIGICVRRRGALLLFSADQ